MRAAYAVTRLGRAGAVRLPKVLGIRPGDSVEIFFENGRRRDSKIRLALRFLQQPR